MSTARASLPGGALVSRRLALAVVIALHLLVLLLWQAPRQRSNGPTNLRTTISVVLLPDVMPGSPVVAPSLPGRPMQSPQPSRRKQPVPPLRTPDLPAMAAPATTRAEAPALHTTTAPPADDAPTATAPSGMAPDPPLLDSAASRRAIAKTARRPSLAAQAGIDNHESAMQTPDVRLGTEIAKGAKGDCIKGEYAGGGMGLLSLPFFAAALLTDQCRK